MAKINKTEKYYDGLIGEDVVIGLGARLPVITLFPKHTAIYRHYFSENSKISDGVDNLYSFHECSDKPISWSVEGEIKVKDGEVLFIRFWIILKDEKIAEMSVFKDMVIPGHTIFEDVQEISVSILWSAIRGYYLRRTKEDNNG